MPSPEDRRASLRARVDYWCERLKATPRIVRIQRMTRKWGSCSTGGIITLAEDLADQDRGLALAQDLGDPEIVKWVNLHRDIIVRFGRFPHRNAALSRRSTPEEAGFLSTPAR